MPISSSDAAHLLRRSGFGVTPAMLAEVTALPNREAAITRVLDVSRAPSIADCPVGTGKAANEATAWWDLTTWWIERMRTSPVPIVEKLTLFWHDHFVTSFAKLTDIGLLNQQHRIFRTHGLGDFHNLAQRVCTDPAMLIYLDNYLNIVGRPQENFGRELMELFTLGPGSYTQKDVVTMTKAWTGYTVDANTGYRTPRYMPTWHDTSTSTLFGKSDKWEGPAALTEVIKGSKAVACSRFVTAKLFSYLAYPATPQDGVVINLAAKYRAGGLNVLELVREIFRSPEFWSPQARGALVRSPLEWFVAAMQATGLDSRTAGPLNYLERAGQMPFAHADVNGWPTGAEWLNTSSAWAKSSFADNARYLIWASKLFSEIHLLPLEEIVSTACAQFGIVELSPTTRAAIEGLYQRMWAEGYPYFLGMNLAMVLLLSPEFQIA